MSQHHTTSSVLPTLAAPPSVLTSSLVPCCCHPCPARCLSGSSSLRGQGPRQVRVTTAPSVGSSTSCCFALMAQSRTNSALAGAGGYSVTSDLNPHPVSSTQHCYHNHVWVLRMLLQCPSLLFTATYTQTIINLLLTCLALWCLGGFETHSGKDQAAGEVTPQHQDPPQQSQQETPLQIHESDFMNRSLKYCKS